MQALDLRDQLNDLTSEAAESEPREAGRLLARHNELVRLATGVDAHWEDVE